MLKLMSRFMIQVLPPAFATFIGGFLLTTYHYYFMSPSTPIVTPRLGVIEPVPPPPGGVSQLVDAAHASVPEQPRPGPVAERKPIIDPKPEPRAEDGRPEPKAEGTQKNAR